MLKEVLEQHAIWQKINNGECPNLEDANLEGIDFKGADLSNANLKGANLAGAILEGANLIWDKEYKYQVVKVVVLDMQGNVVDKSEYPLPINSYEKGTIFDNLAKFIRNGYKT